MSDKPREEWDGKPIPMERWGKDHWSTFAYIETRVVDYHGVINDRNMRGHMAGWEQYATRLKDAELFGHSDFDCAADAVYAGLLRYVEDDTPEPRRRKDSWLYLRGARFALTPLGQTVAGLLRAHKGNGGNFAAFDPTGAMV